MDYVTVVVKIPREKFDVLTSDEFYTFPTECKEWGSRAIRNGIPIGNYASSLAVTMEKTPKVGKWLWKETGYNTEKGTVGNWVCSVCKSAIDKNVPLGATDHVINFNYCPKCGAKLERLNLFSEN